MEEAQDDGLKIVREERIEKSLQRAASSIREFLKYAVLTNTYEEARSWVDDHKSEFAEELEQVADSLYRPIDNGPRWQQDPFFFKWRLFAETFRTGGESAHDQPRLILMALQMFISENRRETPAHWSETHASLLFELRAFLKTVLIPARDLVKKDPREHNNLSLK